MGSPENSDLQAIINQLQEENNQLKKQLRVSIDSTTNNGNDWFLNAAQKVSKIGLWRYSFVENKLYCSDEVYKIFESQAPIELSNLEVLRQYISAEDIERLYQLSQQTLTNNDFFDIDFQIQLSDGYNKYVSVKSKIERNSEGKRVQVVGTISDISDYHYKLLKLQENENLFRNLFNNLTDIFFILEIVKDKNGNIVDYVYKDVNPVFEMIFDLPKSNIINKAFSNQIQIFQQFHPIFKITALTREPFQDRFFVQSLDSFLDILVYSPSENLIATIWRDVSLMVEATTSLQESEEKYRQIFSIGNDGLFLIDYHTTQIFDVNPAGCSIFGFQKEELLSMHFKNLFLSPDQFEHKILERKLAHAVETNINKNGVQFPTETSLSYFNWSGRKVVIISVRDISERLKAQEDLVSSEKKFKQLFDYSNDAIMIVKNYKIIDFNQKTQQIFNLPADLIKNKTLWNLSPIRQANGEDSRIKMMELIQSTLMGNQSQIDWNMQRSDKSIFNADIKLSPILFDTEKVVQIILRDVSPQRKIEEERKQKEERWRYALDINTVGLWDWNVLTNEVYFSSSWKKMIGYEKDEIENKFDEFEKRIHPNDLMLVYNNIDAYLTGKQYNFSIEFRIRCKNGTYKWMGSKGKIYTYTIDGKPEHFIGINTDITRQKQVEIEQDEKIKSLTSAFNLSKIGNWKLDLKTMIISGPQFTFSIFGFESTTQTSLKQIEELVHPEDQKQFMAQFIGSSTPDYKAIVFRAVIHGFNKFIAANLTPIFSKNTLIGYEGIFQDISFFKEHEIRLKDEQYLLKVISELSQQSAILVIDKEIIYSKNKLIELIGFTEEEINQQKNGIMNIFVPEDKQKVDKAIENSIRTSKASESIEVRIETKHHKIKWIELVICQIEYKGSKPLLFMFNQITEKKFAEHKLLESESRFKMISEKSPSGIAIIDDQESIIYSNKTFQTIGKQSKTKAVSIKDLFREIDYQQFKNGFETVKIQQNEMFQCEFILINNSWHNITLTQLDPTRERNNNYLVQIENIDIPKRQIELLTDENLISKKLLENHYMGMGTFLSNQKLSYYNPYLLEIFGFKDSSTIPDFSDFNIHHEGRAIDFKEIIKTGKKLEFHYQTDERWLKVVLIPLGAAPNNTLLIYAIDITNERYDYYKTLDLLQKHTSIFEEAPVGIALIDKNRNIELANKRYKQIWSIEDKNKMQSFDKLVPFDALQNSISKFAELFSGVSDEVIQVIELSSGIETPRYLAIKTSPCKDKYNEVPFVIQVVEDITKRKTNEKTLINEEKYKTLNQLANSFAHEFNNLLMSVFGNAYLLKSNLADNKELCGYAESLFTTITKAGNLSQKLLSFSKTAKSIHVSNTIGEIISKSTENINIPASIQLTINHENPNEKLICDPPQFIRSIENILQNSIEAMPNGGQLSLETKMVYFQDKTKVIPGLDLGKHLLINIKDTGSGIPANEIDKIFDPFYSIRTNQFKSGLGLTIAQNTIEHLNGTIKVESQLNIGTNMKIYLPIKDNHEMALISQPEEQHIVKGSANILLVDDEDVVRIVVSELLKKLGYSVFGFSNPSNAIQFYKENIDNIDVVILDKQMPKMDGIEAFNHLKEHNPEIKVILLTGYNLDDELGKVFQQGKNKLLQKPVSIEKLSNAISSLLS